MSEKSFICYLHRAVKAIASIYLHINYASIYYTNLGIEGSKADLLGLLDQARVRVLPGNRDRGLFVGVYDEVEAAGLVEEGQEGYGRGDLADDRLDLLRYLLQRLDALTSKDTIINIKGILRL